MQIETSYKTHIKLAALLSLWLVGFLILIAPFDIAELSFKNRLILMPIYGVINFFSYMILVPIQNKYYYRLHAWSYLLELLFLILFNFCVLFGSFLYYKSSLVNGIYGFWELAFSVYYPIFFVIIFVIVFLRWFYIQKKDIVPNNRISLQGENRFDTLQVSLTDLVSISSSDNYVEVHYLINGAPNKKLLRNTLTKIAQDHPELLRIHRSHLINPTHFIAWKNANSIEVTGAELPVTKTYKAALLEHLKSRP